MSNFFTLLLARETFHAIFHRGEGVGGTHVYRRIQVARACISVVSMVDCTGGKSECFVGWFTHVFLWLVNLVFADSITSATKVVARLKPAVA